MVLGVVLGASARPGAAAPVTAAEAELIATYAPVVRLKEQPEACGPGEPYQPTDVDLLMDDVEVALRGPWNPADLVEIGPSADTLGEGLFGYHLDFPGDPLDPGCDYEEWSDRLTDGSPPTVYGRVATEAGVANRIALQYWFFYPFNDFNNKHEGDWEMIQLVFDAGDAEGALAAGPTEVGYSQHESAERAGWSDDKLQRVDGTHPVVYPASGSHANYYDSALYLGRTGAEGVGCDDTTGPSVQVRPVVDDVPTAPADYLPEYPWLGFEGRWGEMQPAFFNGPTGPNTKPQWTRPITWSQEEWRDESFAVPAAGTGGTSATGFFCGAVATGSDLLRRLTSDPGTTLLVVAILGALFVWFVTRTAWRPSTPLRVARRRTVGQVLSATWRMYVGHPRLFLGIGLAFIPIGLVITGLQYLIFRIGTLEPLLLSTGEQNGALALLALGLGSVLTLFAFSIVVATVARTMVELDAGRPVTPLSAYRGVTDSIRPLLGALAIAVVVQVALSFTIVGIPLGIFLLVRWSLLGAVVEVESHGVRGVLRRSASLVRGHWPKTFLLVVGVSTAAILVGPFVGALVLLVSGAAFNLVNLLAALIYVLVMPFAAIATGYTYFDLRARREVGDADAGAGARRRDRGRRRGDDDRRRRGGDAPAVSVRGGARTSARGNPRPTTEDVGR